MLQKSILTNINYININYNEYCHPPALTTRPIVESFIDAGGTHPAGVTIWLLPFPRFLAEASPPPPSLRAPDSTCVQVCISSYRDCDECMCGRISNEFRRATSPIPPQGSLLFHTPLAQAISVPTSHLPEPSPSPYPVVPSPLCSLSSAN